LEDFPLFLFCRGNTQLLKSEDNIAVIGTRENSEVGARIAKSTAHHFASTGFTIVSGLAKGIDSIAHQAALGLMAKPLLFSLMCKKFIQRRIKN
jgi:DNA processing protein